MAQLHLELLERNPKQLRVGLRPITAKQLLWRTGAGILWLGLGFQFWGRSLLLGLISIGAGIGIGIPWELGHTLSLDRQTQKVALTQHCGPWGLWRQQVFSQKC